MKKLVIAFAMLLSGMCFAQSYTKSSGTSKPIPRKTNFVKIYATLPKKLQMEDVEESDSKFM